MGDTSREIVANGENASGIWRTEMARFAIASLMEPQPSLAEYFRSSRSISISEPAGRIASRTSNISRTPEEINMSIEERTINRVASSDSLPSVPSFPDLTINNNFAFTPNVSDDIGMSSGSSSRANSVERNRRRRSDSCSVAATPSIKETVDYRLKSRSVKLATFCCATEPGEALISSMEFDLPGSLFSVADMSKTVKIYDFEPILTRPRDAHVPQKLLTNKSTVISTAWSPEIPAILACADKDGDIILWNVETGQMLRTLAEHGSRCWNVAFNSAEPELFASGSNDGKVKLWNCNDGCHRAVAEIEGLASVCSVCFSPTDKNHLVFGSADHCVHHYDIRKVNKPIRILEGHKKAVSYVRYINNNEVVSASTDSTLRVWDIVTAECTDIMQGHKNSKDFVGLSGSGDHLLCGSEDNKAYVYYKKRPKPLCSYEMYNNVLLPEPLVSAVCWKKNTDYALVANSQGRIDLIEIS